MSTSGAEDGAVRLVLYWKHECSAGDPRNASRDAYIASTVDRCSWCGTRRPDDGAVRLSEVEVAELDARGATPASIAYFERILAARRPADEDGLREALRMIEEVAALERQSRGSVSPARAIDLDIIRDILARYPAEPLED